MSNIFFNSESIDCVSIDGLSINSGHAKMYSLMAEFDHPTMKMLVNKLANCRTPFGGDKVSPQYRRNMLSDIEGKGTDVVHIAQYYYIMLDLKSPVENEETILLQKLARMGGYMYEERKLDECNFYIKAYTNLLYHRAPITWIDCGKSGRVCINRFIKELKDFEKLNGKNTDKFSDNDSSIVIRFNPYKDERSISKSKQALRVNRVQDNSNKLCTIKDNDENIWNVLSLLGSGGFGLVYTCVRDDDTNGVVHAVKFEPADLDTLNQETLIYDKLQADKNIRKNGRSFLNYVSEGSCSLKSLHSTHNKHVRSIDNLVPYNFIILEKASNSLQSILKRDKCLSYRSIIKTALSVSIALEKLHKHGFAHRDLKPDNIVFDKFSVMLIDFGVAAKIKNVYNSSFRHDWGGTLVYASLDSHRNNVTAISDYECLLYNIFTWSGQMLPWMYMYEPLDVAESKLYHKNNNYSSISQTLKWCVGERHREFEKLVSIINNTKSTEEPH